MKTIHIIQTAAVSGALAVILGAFGAHGLEPMLEKTGRLATYETAVSYHFYHSLALLMLGILSANFPQINTFKQGAWLFIAGIIVFSGSLYVLSITGVTILGAITPFGGLAFILGWAWLFWGAAKIKSRS